MDRLIQPGESDTVKITLPTARIRGEQSRRIAVTTNDRTSVNASLECAFKVLSPIRTIPETINFGEQARDVEELTKTIKVLRGDGGPIHPRIASTTSKLQAELREIEEGESYEIDLKLQPPWPSGTALREVLTLDTGIAEAQQEALNVYASFKARVQANPSRFSARANATEDADLEVGIEWNGPTPGKALSVSVSDQGLSAQLEDRDGKQFVVLTVPAGYAPRGRTSNIMVMVRTDDPAAPMLNIPIFFENLPPERATGVAKRPARPAVAPPAKPTGQAAPAPGTPSAAPAGQAVPAADAGKAPG